MEEIDVFNNVWYRNQTICSENGKLACSVICVDYNIGEVEESEKFVSW